jgi:hypothetical protein
MERLDINEGIDNNKYSNISLFSPLLSLFET